MVCSTCQSACSPALKRSTLHGPSTAAVEELLISLALTYVCSVLRRQLDVFSRTIPTGLFIAMKRKRRWFGTSAKSQKSLLARRSSWDQKLSFLVKFLLCLKKKIKRQKVVIKEKYIYIHIQISLLFYSWLNKRNKSSSNNAEVKFNIDFYYNKIGSLLRVKYLTHVHAPGRAWGHVTHVHAPGGKRSRRVAPSGENIIKLSYTRCAINKSDEFFEVNVISD